MHGLANAFDLPLLAVTFIRNVHTFACSTDDLTASRPHLIVYYAIIIEVATRSSSFVNAGFVYACVTLHLASEYTDLWAITIANCELNTQSTF